jgi:methyl-accepting chemotaxis protein
MKKWTIGKRIIIGFSGLILLAILLGSLAVWKMSGVKTIANTLAGDYMPATGVANNVERESLQTMFDMRGYSFTEDTNFLAKGLADLGNVKKYLQEAKDLASKNGNGNLTFLQQAAEKAETKALEYEDLAKQTVAATEGLEKDRANMLIASQDYMRQCNDYMAMQNASLQASLKTNVTSNGDGFDLAKAQDCIAKLNAAVEIMNLGNTIRVGNFRAQATRDPELFRATQKKFAEVNQKLDALKAITHLEVDFKEIADCRAAGQAYNDAMTSFLNHWLERENLNAKRLAVANAVLAEAKNTAVSSLDSSAKGATAAFNSLTTASTTMIVGLILAALIGITLAIFISRAITQTLKGISNTLDEGAEQVTSAAGQVSASSQTLAEGASEQAASLEETSSSLEEMSSMTKRNAENAQKANDLAKQARTAADKGAGDMQTMNAAMEAIKVSSNDIAKIIKTIDEIAFQTNILALNAAVEAARAGEAGMGFAVVADEVRNLAQRSAQAAKETADKIEGAIAKTAQGVEISTKVSQALNEIVTKARQVDELVSEVAGASREQTQGITQVNTAVGQMDKVTQSNAASAEESAAAAEELNAQAVAMKESVAELLQLVGGNHQTVAVKTAVLPSPAHKTASAAKPSASIHGNGQPNGNRNGNGQSHAKPELVNVAKSRSEIPLEGDFKDF